MLLWTLLLLPSVFVCGQGTANAQTITVSGTVTDDSGEPLIGATVKVKDAAHGTTTDINGKYTLKVKQDALLIFSYIGCESKEMRAKSAKLWRSTKWW